MLFGTQLGESCAWWFMENRHCSSLDEINAETLLALFKEQIIGGVDLALYEFANSKDDAGVKLFEEFWAIDDDAVHVSPHIVS